jgi:hypothetical protein
MSRTNCSGLKHRYLEYIRYIILRYNVDINDFVGFIVWIVHKGYTALNLTEYFCFSSNCRQGRKIVEHVIEWTKSHVRVEVTCLDFINTVLALKYLKCSKWHFDSDILSLSGTVDLAVSMLLRTHSASSVFVGFSSYTAERTNSSG